MAQGSGRGGDSRETTDDTRCKGDAEGRERARSRRRRQFVKAQSCCGETGHSIQAARTGEQRRKGQRRRGKLRPGRDLHGAGPARLRDRARQFPRHQSGWPIVSLHCCPLCPEKQSLRKLSVSRSPQVVPVTPRGGVGSRCPPARAIVRAVRVTNIVLSRTAQHWRSSW